MYNVSVYNVEEIIKGLVVQLRGSSGDDGSIRTVEAVTWGDNGDCGTFLLCVSTSTSTHLSLHTMYNTLAEHFYISCHVFEPLS